MPLKIHAEAKKRLFDAISELIPRLEVKNGIFLDRGQAYSLLQSVEKILPTKGPLRDELVSYVDELPITEFVTDTLSEELQGAEYVSEGSHQKLTQIVGFEDPAVVARRLIEGLESLPRNYKLSILMPAELSTIMQTEQSRLELTGEISLVRGGPELNELCPMPAPSEEMEPGVLSGLFGHGSHSLLNSKPRWEDGAIYLQIDKIGFIGLYGGSLPHADTLRNASFLRSRSRA
jgi:hypothetical protein